MSEEPVRKGGRPPKDPGEGRRPTVTFRCRPSLHRQLQEASAASGRSVSEEIERRLDASFAGPVIAEAAANAVGAATERKAAAERASTETIFSTLEEFEAIVGGRDACNFGTHVGQSLAHHISRDAKDAPGGISWWEDEARQQSIRTRILKSVSGLLDNWDFVQKSGLIPSVGWVIDQKIKAKVASGEYERRAEAADQQKDREGD